MPLNTRYKAARKLRMTRSLKQNLPGSPSKTPESFASRTILREQGAILHRLEGFVSAIATGTNIIVTVEKKSQLASVPTELGGIPIEARTGESILATTGIFPLPQFPLNPAR